MEQEKRQRHVKVTGAATHRVGTLRAAVKPGSTKKNEAKQPPADQNNKAGNSQEKRAQ